MIAPRLHSGVHGSHRGMATPKSTPPAPSKTPTAQGRSETSAPRSANREGGEGDYASAERYGEEAKAFAKSGKVEPAARAAKAAVEGDEAEELAAAEAEGKSRSKGDDDDDA